MFAFGFNVFSCLLDFVFNCFLLFWVWCFSLLDWLVLMVWLWLACDLFCYLLFVSWFFWVVMMYLVCFLVVLRLNYDCLSDVVSGDCCRINCVCFTIVKVVLYVFGGKVACCLLFVLPGWVWLFGFACLFGFTNSVFVCTWLWVVCDVYCFLFDNCYLICLLMCWLLLIDNSSCSCEYIILLYY